MPRKVKPDTIIRIASASRGAGLESVAFSTGKRWTVPEYETFVWQDLREVLAQMPDGTTVTGQAEGGRILWRRVLVNPSPAPSQPGALVHVGACGAYGLESLPNHQQDLRRIEAQIGQLNARLELLTLLGAGEEEEEEEEEEEVSSVAPPKTLTGLLVERFADRLIGKLLKDPGPENNNNG